MTGVRRVRRRSTARPDVQVLPFLLLPFRFSKIASNRDNVVGPSLWTCDNSRASDVNVARNASRSDISGSAV